MKHERKVIYTAIFGGKDELLRPARIPAGWDFVCFTDEETATHPSFKKNNDIWDVRIVERSHDDPVRNARKYKVLPHRYLGGYDVSFWIDGNIVVRGDIDALIQDHLVDTNIAVYDHTKNPWDPWDSAEREAQALIELAERGRVKDDPAIIEKQLAAYQADGFCSQNGHIVSMIMLRRHNEPDVIAAMERWWQEIERWSKRDQMAFNYAAWKTGLKFNWLPGDSRDNEYFKHTLHLAHRVTLRRRVELALDKAGRLFS